MVAFLRGAATVVRGSCRWWMSWPSSSQLPRWAVTKMVEEGVV